VPRKKNHLCFVHNKKPGEPLRGGRGQQLTPPKRKKGKKRASVPLPQGNLIVKKGKRGEGGGLKKREEELDLESDKGEMGKYYIQEQDRVAFVGKGKKGGEVKKKKRGEM